MRRIISPYVVAFLVVFFPCSKVHSGFSLGISPVRWEAEGKPGETLRNVVTLTSGTRAIQKVSVGVGDWTLSDDGAPVFADAGRMPDSAASWIRFRPKEFSVYPRQKQTVRISIQVPNETPSGSYRVALFFEPPKEADQKGKSGAATVFIRGRLALPIYVTVGDARPEGKILDVAWKTLKGKSPLPALKVQNTGNAHLRMNGFFSARGVSGTRFEGIVAGLPLLPGQIRWIPLEFRGEMPPEGSDLDLTLRVDLGQGEQKVSMRVQRPAESTQKSDL